MIVFIATHRDRRTAGLRWGFEPICRVLEISPATVRSAIARPTCARRVADEVLKVRIRTIWDENYQVYGIRKIRAMLGREGQRVSKNRVARLMRELGIRGSAQYAAIRFTDRLVEIGARPSIGTLGDSYDCEDRRAVVRPLLAGSPSTRCPSRSTSTCEPAPHQTEYAEMACQTRPTPSMATTHQTTTGNHPRP